MKSNLIVLLLSVLIVCAMQAQNNTNHVASNTFHKSGLINDNTRYPSKVSKGLISYDEVLQEYDDFNGSPFLHGKELVVDLVQTNGDIHPSITILYDLYNFEIIVKQKEGEDFILDQLQYTGFIFDNDGEKEKYKRVFDGKIKFCKVLYENKDFAFISTQKVRISEKSTPVPGQEDKKRKFQTKTQYFISTKKTIEKARLKNDKLLPLLSYKYRGQVGKLKKKLKLKKLKKEKDYIRLMNAFETESK